MFGPSETGIIRENLMNQYHEEAIEVFYEEYSSKHNELVQHHQDITDLLLYLKEQKYQLGVVTGKARRSLLISLEELSMNHLFDVIITGDDVNLPKPHPEGINKALKKLNLKNMEAVFLGDSEADIVAGKEANVPTFGVKWLPNYQTPEFTVEPDDVFDQTSELIELLMNHRV